MALNQEEILRYSRHLIMPEVGVDGQEKLKAASILLIGCGGLGSPLSMYLAAAGIGHLGLVDFDVTDFTNLQRQVAFGTQDVGRPKVEATKDRINSINPNVKVTTYRTKLSGENVMDIFKEYDIIIDGTDNFPTRYLVNDACVFLHKPNVYGSIFRFEGQATVFWADKGPCYLLFVSRAAASGHGAVLRGRGSAWNSSGDDRPHSGYRSGQTYSREG